ncbi:hypothetical protein A5724_04070 [Mycobacterium sp. ACS1612]|uniref:DUF732 domain-containing protein n=1 Tax=Mycobacterium sp. ACS1612 TaxID=1834117 RepID=UPI0007FD4258|nr:DUF732 domain-containing protein [Mycobacterium sp. ACS1612]OBF25573.1 hypothetical protein A5724_04070 [Mycobacterium sp. ACS1612]
MAMFARIALVSTVFVGALVAAPTAAASPQTDFCRSMAGVGFTQDCATLTALAQDVCTQYNRGVDLTTVLQKLDQTTKNENLSNYIIAGAQVYLCPQRAATT